MKASLPVEERESIVSSPLPTSLNWVASLPCAAQVYNLGLTKWFRRVINGQSSGSESDTAGIESYGQSATAPGSQRNRAIVGLRVIALRHNFAEQVDPLGGRRGA